MFHAPLPLAGHCHVVDFPASQDQNQQQKERPGDDNHFTIYVDEVNLEIVDRQEEDIRAHQEEEERQRLLDEIRAGLRHLVVNLFILGFLRWFLHLRQEL
ncbi:hypothetical protein VNI00_012492 [Paramarasmius palmivorus]|uniref:Uncharacterized protein n=1 Tax=Paramarasmius palmivorus TaxID=297713 RepID=A0AAW0C491_9AGAR